MRLAGEHLGDDDLVQVHAAGFDALDLHARHGEQFGQGLGRAVVVDVVAQPIEGDFHTGTGKLRARGRMSSGENRFEAFLANRRMTMRQNTGLIIP